MNNVDGETNFSFTLKEESANRNLVSEIIYIIPNEVRANFLKIRSPISGVTTFIRIGYYNKI